MIKVSATPLAIGEQGSNEEGNNLVTLKDRPRGGLEHAGVNWSKDPYIKKLECHTTNAVQVSFGIEAFGVAGNKARNKNLIKNFEFLLNVTLESL